MVTPNIYMQKLRDLTSSALCSLESRQSPDEDSLHLLLQIMYMPSFDDWISWSIFRNSNETSIVIRRSNWKKLFDFQRFRDPMAGLKYGLSTDPSISSRMICLPEDFIVSFLRELQNMDIPELISKSLVLDGVRWSVFVDGKFNNRVLSWNSEPPEWEALIDWTSRLIHILEIAPS